MNTTFARQTVSDRFWSKVNKTTSCWIWTGSKQLHRKYDAGYGYFSTAAKVVYAHRYSWELHFKSIPKGICVLHKCDNTLCVNPSHLFLGTHLDNSKDKYAKKREARGETHGLAKLTEADVLRIRAAHAARKGRCYGATMFAKEFGVDRLTINSIVMRKTWTHI